LQGLRSHDRAYLVEPWGVKFSPRPVNAWDSGESGPLPTQPDTEPHFIGRFTAAQFAREAFVLAYLGAVGPPSGGQVASSRTVVTAWSAAAKVKAWSATTKVAVPGQ
jgi:hypothetical protein